MAKYKGRTKGYWKDQFYVKQGGICAYCKTYCTPAMFNIDHIFPASKGGSNRKDNLIGVCIKCNKRKSNHSLESFLKAVG